ncbi:hypothetical protein ACLMJK_008944 [Lecanora helva]
MKSKRSKKAKRAALKAQAIALFEETSTPKASNPEPGDTKLSPPPTTDVDFKPSELVDRNGNSEAWESERCSVLCRQEKLETRMDAVGNATNVSVGPITQHQGQPLVQSSHNIHDHNFSCLRAQSPMLPELLEELMEGQDKLEALFRHQSALLTRLSRIASARPDLVVAGGQWTVEQSSRHTHRGF